MLLGDFNVQTVDKRFMAILIPKRDPNKTDADELADEEDNAAISKAGSEVEYEWVRALRYKVEKLAETDIAAGTEEEDERQRFEEQLRCDNICLFTEDDKVRGKWNTFAFGFIESLFRLKVSYHEWCLVRLVY